MKNLIENPIEFYKMQGLGNDYVYLLCIDKELPENLPLLARQISDRHFGVGSDGLIIICHSDIADFRMRMFNADGSEAQMCGNASRCIAKLLYLNGLVKSDEITLQTEAGIKTLKLHIENNEVKAVSVNMGKPILVNEEIPVAGESESVEGGLSKTCATINGRTFEIYPVSMGNPHGVIYETLSEEDFQKFGPLLESHEIWPEKANIEFIKVVDAHTIEMRVWERGSGETLACGTGACASAVASILSGKTDNGVTVRMRGGDLDIKINENGEVIMTGGAELVAQGYYHRNSFPENLYKS